MITVADIIALPVFSRIEPIAEIPGAGKRLVHNVGIMDVSPDVNGYRVYHPGEFILTNMGFCVGDVAASEHALEVMVARGVAGVAIKTVYGARITERMREASRASGVPVYVYEGRFHEYVAYAALDLIKADERAADKNDAIDALLAGHDGRDTRERIRDIADASGSTMRCLAVAPHVGDDLSLYAVLSTLRAKLLEYQAAYPSVETAYACRYRDALVVFVSFGGYPGKEQADRRLRDVVASVGRICCGVGDEVPLADGDLSVRQAIMLLDEAQAAGRDFVEWSDVGGRAFALAAQADRLFMRTCALYEERLRAYDEQNAADLMLTARAFVAAFGEVRVAADVIHQHPNTVRFRLRKVKALLGMGDASNRELLAFLELIVLPERVRETPRG